MILKVCYHEMSNASYEWWYKYFNDTKAKFVAENSLTVEKTLVGTLVNANEMLLTTPVINIAQLTILIDNLILNCVSPSFLQLHGYYTN